MGAMEQLIELTFLSETPKIFSMGNTNNSNGSRRWFLSFGFARKEEKNKAADSPADMVKMLTPDGKLVEVPRSLVESSSTTQKASNKDILSWMKNPSKR